MRNTCKMQNTFENIDFYSIAGNINTPAWQTAQPVSLITVDECHLIVQTSACLADGFLVFKTLIRTVNLQTEDSTAMPKKASLSIPSLPAAILVRFPDPQDNEHNTDSQNVQGASFHNCYSGLTDAKMRTPWIYSQRSNQGCPGGMEFLKAWLNLFMQWLSGCFGRTCIM